MRIYSTALLSGALALTLAGTASATDAYKLTPPKTSFTADGSGTVRGPPGMYTCSISMTGFTENTVGEITGATLSGAPGCENVVAVGLPWHVRPISDTKVQISDVALSYSALGRCGPNQIKATLVGGVMTIKDNLPSNEGECHVSASLTTTPAISITGP